MSSDEVQTVAVRIESSPTALGGTVTAVVTVQGNPDRKVREVKAQLVRSAFHRYTQTNITDHGSHDSLSYEAVVITETLISSDRPGAPGEYLLSLQVPEDGLPSAVGQVAWSVRAVIDRRHGHDVTAEAPVQVLSGPERFTSEANDDPRHVGERCVDLKLSSPRTLRAGETVTGNVELRPTRAMTVTRIGVLFVRTTSDKSGLTGNVIAPQTLFEEPVHLQPGDTRSLPFDLTLLADAAPTVRGSLTTPRCHSMIAWEVGAQVTAVLSPDGKAADSFVFVGLNVYNTGGDSSRATSDEPSEP